MVLLHEINGSIKKDILDEVTRMNDEFRDELATDEIKQKLGNCERSISNMKSDMENEHLKSEVKSLKKDVTSQKTDFINLKVRMETSNVEKILIVEDEPSPAKCKNCKSYSCLKGKK